MYIQSFDGTRIWYKIEKKSGLFLIFIHGWVSNWTIWKSEIEFFRRKGYSIIAIDLRGHGSSDKPQEKEKYRIENLARDINEIVLKEKVKKFVLIGHSMGGMVSLAYKNLFDSKKIKGLVLCDTTCRNVLEHKSLKKISPFIHHFLDFVISHKKIRKKHFSHLKQTDFTRFKKRGDFFIFCRGILQTPLKSMLCCLESMIDFDASRSLKTIAVPVLIIEGIKDSYLPLCDSKEMHIKIKNSTLDKIQDGHHCVNVQSPELISGHIEDFLQKQKLTSKPR